MPQCNEPGCSYKGSLRSLKRHYRREQPGEIATPEDELPDAESEQRDFEGENPTEDGHDPEYLTENEPADVEDISIFEFDEEEEDEQP